MGVESSYTALCRRIVEYCQARGWYGPESALDGPMETERYVMEADGALRHRFVTHDPRLGFEFAPATKDQLQATEQALGFALPPLLRAVYTQVANGGFGPGEGLIGVQGGFVYGQDQHYTTLDRVEPPRWATRLLDLRPHEFAADRPLRITLPPHTWPAHFVPLCYWGCGSDSYLDADSERVYHLLDVSSSAVVLMKQEDSLERWLEAWLRGTWREWFVWGDEEDLPF